MAAASVSSTPVPSLNPASPKPLSPTVAAARELQIKSWTRAKGPVPGNFNAAEIAGIERFLNLITAMARWESAKHEKDIEDLGTFEELIEDTFQTIAGRDPKLVFPFP